MQLHEWTRASAQGVLMTVDSAKTQSQIETKL